MANKMKIAKLKEGFKMLENNYLGGSGQLLVMGK